MFLTNADMCECNEFPIYTQQLPNNAPPPEEPLPPAFQMLCLACINQVYSEFTQPSDPYRRIAASIFNLFYTDSLHATYLTCYGDYYHIDKPFESYSEIEIQKARAWTELRVDDELAKLGNDQVVHGAE
jgi:hypothetical protein